MEARQELVTITVGGRKVMVPGQTSTTEIRTIAGLDRGHVLARTSDGANRVVSGSLQVREGEAFAVGRSFTKGSMDDTRLLDELERLSHFFELEADDRLSWVLIYGYGLPEGYNRQQIDILFNTAGFPYIPPASIFGVYMERGLTYSGRRLPNYYEALTRRMFGREWAWFCTGHMAWDPLKDDLKTFLVTLDLMLADPLGERLEDIADA
ncbi:MAG: E2/UBC family protein [Methanocella sp.]